MSSDGGLTPPALATMQEFARKYPPDAARIAAIYIHAPNQAEAVEGRREVAGLLVKHLFNGAARDEIAHFLEFFLEVAERRSIEALRPSSWSELASALPDQNRHLVGGE